MWTCPSCRTTNGADAMVCPSCGRPREDQIATAVPGTLTGEPDAPHVGDYSTIEKKIHRMRLRKDLIFRWSRIIGLATFLTTIVLIVILVFPHLKSQKSLTDVFAEVAGIALFAAVFGSVVGLVGGVAVAVLRPILIALFRSPEEFEREFGPVSRPREDQSATAVPGAPTGEPDAPHVGDYSTIEKKIRRVRIRKDMVARWAVLFGVAGFVTSFILLAVFLPAEDGFGRRMELAIGGAAVISLVGAVIGAAIACMLEMLRPISVALLSSPEAFEREFGPVSNPRKDNKQ